MSSTNDDIRSRVIASAINILFKLLTISIINHHHEDEPTTTIAFHPTEYIIAITLGSEPGVWGLSPPTKYV